MKLSSEERELVRAGVRHHLSRSPAYHALPGDRQNSLASDLSAISEARLADVEPASLAGLLAAVDFPAFVSDLVGGVFESIVDASIQQMKAYADLVRSTAESLKGAREETNDDTHDRRLLRPLRPEVARATPKLDLRAVHELRLPHLADEPPVADNIRAVAAILVAAELEEVRLFAVVDRIVMGFVSGALPITRDGGGALLYEYTKRAQSRLDAAERAALYTRVLGRPGPSGDANVAFDGLWRDLLSVVAEARPEDPAIRAAALALARNASDHGGGATKVAAATLTTQVQACMAIVGHPAIQAAYGARDPWSLVERVAALELGAQIASVRGRTLASTGAAILGWLADHGAAITSGAELPIGPLAEAVARWLEASAS